MLLQTINQNRIPFSFIKQTATELASKDCTLEPGDGPTLIATLGTMEKLGIPFEKYFLQSNVNLRLQKDPQMLPEEVPEAAPAGVMVAMNGELWVVVELAEGECMWLAPASCIDITR